MVRTEAKLKSFLQCPNCGEFHQFERSGRSENLVCLYCEAVFSTDDFQPYAITYKKTGASVSPF